MYRWTSSNVWFILSIIAMVSVVLSSLHIVVKLLIVVLAIACGYAGINRYIRRMQSEQAEVLAAESHKNEMDLLHISARMRHDMLNDLQILFGYIQLKKYDNLHTTMEKIRIRMLQEGYLSKLGIPALVAYLLAIRSNMLEMELEVEIEEEINLAELPLTPEFITTITRDMISLFKNAARAGNDLELLNVLSLQFVPEEDSLLLDFVFRGYYQRDLLERTIEKMLLTGQTDMAAEEISFAEHEVAVTLKLPFQT